MFFTENILTCNCRKSVGGTNNTNDDWLSFLEVPQCDVMHNTKALEQAEQSLILLITTELFLPKCPGLNVHSEKGYLEDYIMNSAS